MQAVIADIEREIIIAWSDVKAPPSDCITVHRCDECDEIAQFFDAKRWQDLTDVEQLRYNEAALTLFTPDAFHYYLPAFMLATLHDPAEADVIPDGIRSNIKRERVGSFNPAQRDAVLRFLRALPMLQIADVEDVEKAIRALDIDV